MITSFQFSGSFSYSQFLTISCCISTLSLPGPILKSSAARPSLPADSLLLSCLMAYRSKLAQFLLQTSVKQAGVSLQPLQQLFVRLCKTALLGLEARGLLFPQSFVVFRVLLGFTCGRVLHSARIVRLCTFRRTIPFSLHEISG